MMTRFKDLRGDMLALTDDEGQQHGPVNPHLNLKVETETVSHGRCLHFQMRIALRHPRIFQSDSVDMFSVANDIQQITTGPFNLTTDKNRVSRFLSGDKHGLT